MISTSDENRKNVGGPKCRQSHIYPHDACTLSCALGISNWNHTNQGKCVRLRINLSKIKARGSSVDTVQAMVESKCQMKIGPAAERPRNLMQVRERCPLERSFPAVERPGVLWPALPRLKHHEVERQSNLHSPPNPFFSVGRYGGLSKSPTTLAPPLDPLTPFGPRTEATAVHEDGAARDGRCCGRCCRCYRCWRCRCWCF